MAEKSKTANFTDVELAAMKETAAERRTARSRSKKDPEQIRREGEEELLGKLAELSDDDRELGEALHKLVTETAPHLVPRTYYGMPAWGKDGKVLCFFQAASKFKVRYATFGFDPTAALDDGNVWPTSFAVTKLGAKELDFLGELIRRAAS
ncbi:uncharacterized protein YdhG (YjbR/CyaY superfamily) [Microbacterium sp. W4I4]|uniref:iron chaperone n=1 Tax=Microbacterium sp. W4I4 TaxID=3042295 RepID=UPI00278704AB|nr:DUF1801 domain-containing protein [Microbacterium sp. W4I4]MDQ0614615.1 uncharacterized protein YdhG (YjbR/CyaY superfamily) [Microbacterium sp. W4I4]